MSCFIDPKSLLWQAVEELSSSPSEFAVDPSRDFTRRRKLSFKNTIHLLLSMDGGSIQEELFRFFGRTIDAPTKAAFCRQRQKISDIEELADIVVVGRSRDDNEVGIAVSCSLICCCVEAQLALAIACFGEEALDLVVLDRAVELVELVSLCRCSCNRGDIVVLREEHSQTRG